MSDNIENRPEWYAAFLEECRAIITETVYNSRIELLQGKWELGKRITEQENLFNQRAVYGLQIIETIARDLGRGTSDIWYCVQFFKTYPESEFSAVMEKLPEGKSISWQKVKTVYLPKHTEKKKRRVLFMSFPVEAGQSRPVGEHGSYTNNLSEPVFVKVYVEREE